MIQGHKTGKKLKASAARIYPDFPKVLPGIQICKGKPNIHHHRRYRMSLAHCL